ncbi:hypothetical protein DFQ27_007257 [Actinomortierella ambigua]|uniref:Endonuclease/exonuclease/phosphatase domain-containing protein n=1 Tax=Actinomortierella ambigua TaxID=1343610 RepID=A0A9P6PVN6_9FUNG|nr:hypothetical protein DFQ27_007257 [Actinomortierella ambigua]
MANPVLPTEELPLHKIKVFIPFHSDFSQLETCAPFLDRYGGVILVYDWNVAKEAITKYYEQQYPDGWVKVIPFSLRNILYAIQHLDHRTIRGESTTIKESSSSSNSNKSSNGSWNEEKEEEDPQPQVVFLLMASMNPDYGAFGLTQKRILEAVKDALPERVCSVNIIGHCMYGCASCSGVEHKVPLYFTRYFNRSLPYTAEHILKEYCTLDEGSATSPLPGRINVLVAPSCGSTSMIAQRPLVQLFHRLEQSGRFKFLWKLHPTSLQMEGYDLTDATGEEQAEYDNVQFIVSHFSVTREEHACLLPFMEAFDVVVTDLHSSVPFIATYFTPKVILSYFNDADYGSPERHKEFMDQLNTFVEPDELEKLLIHLPAPKGDPSFFHSQYGFVDGKEDLRFGQLAKWPTEKIRPSTPFLYRETMADLALTWKQIYQGMVDEFKDVEGANNALGFKADFPLLKGTVDPPLVLPRSLPEPHTGAPFPLTILSYNIWNGGFSGGLPLNQTAQVILESGADLVGLQECSKPAVGGASGREYILPELMKLLPGWYFSEQKLDTGGLRGPWAIISRWPIIETTPKGFGAKIQLPQATTTTTTSHHHDHDHPAMQNGIIDSTPPPPRYVYFFNCHLFYFPYQPFQLLKIPYGTQPFLSTADEAIASCTEARGHELDAVLHEIQTVAEADPDVPVFLTGDFNEPSHLDWTPLAVLAGLQPLSVRWPTTQRLYEANMADLWRAHTTVAEGEEEEGQRKGQSPTSSSKAGTTTTGIPSSSKDKGQRQSHNHATTNTNTNTNTTRSSSSSPSLWSPSSLDAIERDVVARPGLTWTCLERELVETDHYDRIDFIFALARESSPVALREPPVKIGEPYAKVGEWNDRVLGPQWPSDHRAVVATVYI